MNSNSRIVLLITALAVALVPSSFAQRQLGKKKGPTSKLYLAETVGQGEITNEGRTYSPKQATAFDAPGTVIQTKADSHQAFVYSNGTGMFVDADTRIEVDRFVQEPFRPDRNTSTETEPSISQSDVFVARGQVGICTGAMVSGSTMNYSTPHAAVNIRGGKLSIKTDGDATTVYLLEGDATVRTGSKDVGGALLRPGEQATIRPGPPGQPPSVTVGPIDRTTAQNLDDKVNVACNAKKSVSFEAIEKKAESGGLAESEKEPAVNPDGTPAESTAPGAGTAFNPGVDDSEQEIVVTPTTPTAPPTNIIVSPDRIGPGE
ncbi:MAG: hypothetical protein C0518_04200 [Opitutus sp.]|nr:hypothetical protein [Opitutus sp.]